MELEALPHPLLNKRSVVFITNISGREQKYGFKNQKENGWLPTMGSAPMNINPQVNVCGFQKAAVWFRRF